MKMSFSGRESFVEFQTLVDPWKIVERERTQRTLQVLTTVTPRNGYDDSKRWKFDVSKLQERWNLKHIRRRLLPRSVKASLVSSLRDSQHFSTYNKDSIESQLASPLGISLDKKMAVKKPIARRRRLLTS